MKCKEDFTKFGNFGLFGLWRAPCFKFFYTPVYILYFLNVSEKLYKLQAGSIEGQVVEMGFTTTSLLSSEKFPVIVPNSFFSSQVGLLSPPLFLLYSLQQSREVVALISIRMFLA